MPNLRLSQKAFLNGSYVMGVQLGVKTVAPNLKWPLAAVPSTSTTVNRSLFAANEQRLARDLVTLAPLANDMVADPSSDLWGWFGDSGWFRPNTLVPHNSRLQESVGTLAWFYTHDRPWNPYYNSQPVAERIIAALRYTLSIQLSDGGFQEYTAGVSGPASTGFTLGHLALLYVNLESVTLKMPGWDDYWKPRVFQSMIRAAEWVLDETNDTSWVGGGYHSNQLVAGIAGAARIRDLLPTALRTKFNAAVTRLSTHIVSDVGYMYENYGPDFGYSRGVGIPYIAYLYEVTGDAGLATVINKTFDFFSYNHLLEPDQLGYIINDGISTRTRARVQERSRTDENGSDSFGVARLAAPKSNAFITSQESKVTMRADWAASNSPISLLAKGSFSPHRIHRSTDSESYPTAAERDAGLAALPYNASTGFTEYRHDPRSGSEKFDRHYLYVRRPNYFTSVHWGYRADGVRVGQGFLYHPQTGTFVVGQGNSNTNWGLYTDAGGYSDTRVTSYSTSSTIPTGATNFTLALGVSNGASTRTVNYRSADFTVSLERSGAFWERLPLVVWPGGVQAADVISFTLAGGGTQTAGEETVTVNATAVTVTRAGLGALTLTFDQSRSTTLSSVSETAADPYFSAARRQVRHLDIASNDTLNYTVAITLA